MASIAITAIFTGVLVSCLEKNPEDSTFIRIKAGNPIAYAIRLRAAIWTSYWENSLY